MKTYTIQRYVMALSCGILFALAMHQMQYHVTFGVYLDEMMRQARGQGVNDKYLAPLRILQRNTTARIAEVRTLSTRQPEYAFRPWEYLSRMVTQERIAFGRKYLATHASVFDAMERRYGVPREIIVAIWAVETNFGTYKGRFPVIKSLAVLGYDTKRKAFWRKELLAALRILEAGDVRPENMYGSWAGAMGHTQFIPTSYLAYAVDFDGDARRDIWSNIMDALASTANYLKVAGRWERDMPWGYGVLLPAHFDFTLIADNAQKPLRDWAQLGLVGAPQSPHIARLILPGGHRGPAFLVTRNFDALLSYNTAMLYGLAVGYLSDRLAGGKPLVVHWPLGERVLKAAELEELQLYLRMAGFDPIHIDGKLGPKTRHAIMAYQRAYGLVPDSWPTPSLLAHAKHWQTHLRLDLPANTPMLAQQAVARIAGHAIMPRPRNSDTLAQWFALQRQHRDLEIIARPPNPTLRRERNKNEGQDL